MPKQTIFRSGNSLAVTVPADFAQTVGVKAGDAVAVEKRPEVGQVTYSFSGTKQLPLANSFVKRVRR